MWQSHLKVSTSFPVVWGMVVTSQFLLTFLRIKIVCIAYNLKLAGRWQRCFCCSRSVKTGCCKGHLLLCYAPSTSKQTMNLHAIVRSEQREEVLEHLECGEGLGWRSCGQVASTFTCQRQHFGPSKRSLIFNLHFLADIPELAINPCIICDLQFELQINIKFRNPRLFLRRACALPVVSPY